MHADDTVQLRTLRYMPIIGLGTWELRFDTAEVIAHALEAGYCMIDTSGDYGTESGIGKGIKRSSIARDDFYLVTKVEDTDDDAYEALQKNLSELQLDYVDLTLIHRPPREGVGEDLWRNLMRAKEKGLTRDIGVSNYSKAQIIKLAGLTGEVPVVNQIEWSPFGWSKEMLDFCHLNDIVIQAYSPLTHGKRLDDSTLKEVADKHERTPAQVLIRWCLQMGTVPLVKANQLQHLEENLGAFDFELDLEDMIMLAELNENYSALGRQPVYQQQ